MGQRTLRAAEIDGGEAIRNGLSWKRKLLVQRPCGRIEHNTVKNTDNTTQIATV